MIDSLINNVVHRVISNRGLLRARFVLFLGLGLVSLNPTILASEATPTGFGGVTATFEIIDHVVPVDQDMKVRVAYRNTLDRPVTFRYLLADQYAEVYAIGKKIPEINVSVGQAVVSKITLGPGERREFEQGIFLRGWRLTPGRYEIHFFYPLGLLEDQSLKEAYRRKYHVDDYVVPWEDCGHSFVVTAKDARAK